MNYIMSALVNNFIAYLLVIVPALVIALLIFIIYRIVKHLVEEFLR